MKNKILNFLRESKTYVSGEYISNELKVSRAAIWKYIDKLRSEGYVIESSSKKGYILVKEADVLDYNAISPYLETKYMGRDIKYFQSISSTNDVVRSEAEDNRSEGFLAVAEEQTNGRGRLGRHWESSQNTSISMSLLLRPNITPNMAPAITSIFALSVVETLVQLTGFDIGIKWPNDIILDNKKLCGILTEMSAEIDAINYIIIGAGINVNQTDFDGEIKDIAVSLKSFSKENFNRRLLVGSILNSFEIKYEIYQKYGIKYFIADIKKHSVLLGKRVIVKNINNSYEGTAYDIDDDGCLLIKTDDGSTSKLLSGDVSIRAFKGYI